MERANDKYEHTHDVLVASECIGVRELDFGLNFVKLGVFVDDFNEEIVQGNKREDEEEEEDVVAVEKIVRFGGGVIEP